MKQNKTTYLINCRIVTDWHENTSSFWTRAYNIKHELLNGGDFSPTWEAALADHKEMVYQYAE